MDHEVVYNGRPFGGVGFICKNQEGLTYRCIDVDSDRICVLQVISSQKPLLTIIGVYMPYFNGHYEQLELYVETLDVLQYTLDTYASSSPIMIVGDFNANLPQNTYLSSQWYKVKPFNQNSVILYDFIVDNKLSVSNFNFHQNVNYTYSKGNVTSYIDHVLITENTREIVKNCCIHADFANNTSDHLPLSTLISLTLSKHNIASTVSKAQEFPRATWRDKKFVASYTRNIDFCISECTKDIDKWSPIDNNDELTQQMYVDNYFTCLTNALHNSVRIAKDECNASFKGPKRHHWWNTDCQTAKHRQTFWFQIWKSSGRPRDGAVYESYKYAKYVFRQNCRKAFNSASQSNFNLCNKLYKEKNMNKFWNIIKKSRSHNVKHDSISNDSLYSYFNEKFSYDFSNESDLVKTLRRDVDIKRQNCNLPFDCFVFSEYNMVKYVTTLKSGCSAGYDGITSEHLKYALGSILIGNLCYLFTYCFQFGVVPTNFT